MKARLQSVLLGLGGLLSSLSTLSGAPPVPPAAPTVVAAAALRPQIASLVIHLDDGRTYALTAAELADEKGGVIFWNDWAVYSLLVPFYVFHPSLPTSPGDVVRLWAMPSASGELPAFLIKPRCIPSYPLNPAGPSAFPVGRAHRPKVRAIVLGYQDGRSYALNEFELNDARSGVLFWGDYAVKNLLVPFYMFTRGLATTPGDVLKLWNTPVKLNAAGRSLSGEAGDPELPGFIVKPACIPDYPLGDR